MIWKPGKLARGTLTFGFGMGLRALTQALIFLIVARALGVDGFGGFTAVLAIAGSFSCLSGLGANILLIRDVARSPDQFSTSWGYTLMAFCIGMPITALIYAFISWIMLPETIPWGVILLLGASEIVLMPLAGIGAFAYQGKEQMGKASWMQLAPALSRLMGALVFLAICHMQKNFDHLLLWSRLYFCCTLTTAIYILWRVGKSFGTPIFPNTKELINYVRNSIPFSFSGIADKLNVDADKFMLARLASVGTAGMYAAGYRFVDLAYIPLHSLMSTATPRYFRSGQSGIGCALQYSFKIGSMPILYGILIGCLFYWCAPVLTFLLGSSYAEAITVARWLAWLPLIAAFRMLLHYPLATSGLQRDGMYAMLIGACANVGLNFLLIPIWSWRGAVAATYAAEGLMIISMLISIRKCFPLKQVTSLKTERNL